MCNFQRETNGSAADDLDFTGKCQTDITVTHTAKTSVVSVTCDCGNDNVGFTSTKLSSSEISTDSSRTYKFVNEWNCACAGEDEEYRGEAISEAGDLCESEEEVDIECTLAIIKPEAVKHRRAIEYRISEEGFGIQQTRLVRLTSEMVSEFYAEHYGMPYFAQLIAYMSSGPIVVHVLGKNHAIQQWRRLMGPTKVTEARLYFPDSIRALYGTKGQDFENAVHGSVNRRQAEMEIHFFFPDYILEPLLTGQNIDNYLWEFINKALVNALVLCCKVKPADPILWLADWLLTNNPNVPKFNLPQHAE